MAKQRVEVEVDVPDGWQATGEFRSGVINGFDTSLIGRLIIRKIEPVRESRWENLYALGSCRGMRHINRSLADETAVEGRCAVIRIDYENNAPVNVALEPAEGGGA